MVTKNDVFITNFLGFFFLFKSRAKRMERMWEEMDFEEAKSMWEEELNDFVLRYPRLLF